MRLVLVVITNVSVLKNIGSMCADVRTLVSVPVPNYSTQHYGTVGLNGKLADMNTFTDESCCIFTIMTPLTARVLIILWPGTVC